MVTRDSWSIRIDVLLRYCSDRWFNQVDATWQINDSWSDHPTITGLWTYGVLILVSYDRHPERSDMGPRRSNSENSVDSFDWLWKRVENRFDSQLSDPLVNCLMSQPTDWTLRQLSGFSANSLNLQPTVWSLGYNPFTRMISPHRF